MKLFEFSLSDMRKNRNKKKLGEAIAKHKIKDIAHFLQQGTTEVDYLRWVPADFGNGSEKVPAGRYNNAAELAKVVGLPDEGMRLLAQYKLVPAQAPTHAAPKPTR